MGTVFGDLGSSANSSSLSAPPFLDCVLDKPGNSKDEKREVGLIWN